MDPDSTTQLITLVLLLLSSAFFSACETAFTSLSNISVRNMVDEKVRGATLVARLLEKPNKLLSTILVGNNMVNITASSITTALAISYFGAAGVVYATGIMTVLIIIFAEVLPKGVAGSNAKALSVKFAKPLALVIRILTPLTFLLTCITDTVINRTKEPQITENELRTVVEIGHEEGIIQSEERDLINNVFAFGDRPAGDIMTPRPDVAAIDSSWTKQQVLDFFAEEHHSRAPVYEDSVDNIVGIVHIKDIIIADNGKNNFNIYNHMKPPLVAFEFTEAGQLMQQMRQQKVTMAVILDEFGGTAGIMTMEDLLEEIVGEILDEHDDLEQASIQEVTDNEFLVSGSARINEVNELIGTRFESEEYSTIAGYLLEMLDKLPEAGNRIEVDGTSIVVEGIDKNRIHLLRIYTSS